METEEVAVKSFSPGRGFGFFTTTKGDVWFSDQHVKPFVDRLSDIQSGMGARISFTQRKGKFHLAEIIHVDGKTKSDAFIDNEFLPDNLYEGVVKNFSPGRGFGFIKAPGFTACYFNMGDQQKLFRKMVADGVRFEFRVIITSAGRRRAIFERHIQTSDG